MEERQASQGATGGQASADASLEQPPEWIQVLLENQVKQLLQLLSTTLGQLQEASKSIQELKPQ